MTHDRREFSRRCENLISELPIAFPFELTTFLGAVGEQLGHPLELWRMNQVGSKRTGLLLRMIPQNIVCVVRGTTPAHLRHIAFHELGHLLLEHGGNRECSLPGTSRPRIREEQQAERFAFALADRVRVGEARERALHASRPLAQLHAAFGSRHSLMTGHA